MPEGQSNFSRSSFEKNQQALREKQAQREKCAQNFNLIKETDLADFAQEIEELGLTTKEIIIAINKHIVDRKNELKDNFRSKVFVSASGTSAGIIFNYLPEFNKPENEKKIVALLKILNKIFEKNGYVIPEDAVCKEDPQPPIHSQHTQEKPLQKMQTQQKIGTQASIIAEKLEKNEE